MASFSELAPRIAETGRALHARGWALATAGNFSAVVRREPLVLAISRSGVDKGRLTAADILQVDGNGLPLEAGASPRTRRSCTSRSCASAAPAPVLHTHSVWNTLLSEAAGEAGGLAISGYEMLKALAGVGTPRARRVGADHPEHPGLRAHDARTWWRRSRSTRGAHGVLLRGHGLYTWGRDLAEAQRHVETLEFLFEVVGRLYAASGRLRRGGGGGGRRQQMATIRVPARRAGRERAGGRHGVPGGRGHRPRALDADASARRGRVRGRGARGVRARDRAAQGAGAAT